MKLRTIVLCSITSAAFAFAANAATQQASATPDQKGGKTAANTASVSAADQQFAQEAAKGGMMEVAMGEMAAKKATSADVKNFGSKMVTDHGRANDELKSICAKKNIKLPKNTSSQAWTSDKDYMSTMVSDHKKDLAAFEKEAKNGSDPDLKRFASQTAKIISGHLQMAQQISGKLK
jgi:putative membrane protein